jgi:uncharacterized RDD family membrane protein YckC
MKCPKCDYLGFETGDRCRNCGYDFSLMTDSSAAGAADLMLREPDSSAGPNDWIDHLERDLRLSPSAPPTASPSPVAAVPLDTIAVPASTAVARVASDSSSRRAVPLPLFQPGVDDDQPLIRVPAAPRAPLAVRRTPDTPRLRAVPKVARRTVADPAVPLPDVEPVLDFHDEPAAEATIHQETPVARRPRHTPEASGQTSDPLRRLTAAAIDHAILFAIDAMVIYLTLQMAALALSEWRELPVLPMVAFLAMVKGAYFCAFTLVGGQTIGKMATGIRVVMLDGSHLDPARAIRRTLAGALSLMSFGLTFVPGLIAADGRALHDHLAHTRVIASR